MRVTTSHLCYMTTFFMEKLANQHPDKLSLCHVYPGAIITQFGQTGSSPAWLKLLLRYIVVPLMYPFALSQEECGERILFLSSDKYPARNTAKLGDTNSDNKVGVAIATDGAAGGGSYRIKQDGETFNTPDSYNTLRGQGVDDLIWEHTTKAFEVIANGEVFTG